MINSTSCSYWLVRNTLSFIYARDPLCYYNIKFSFGLVMFTSLEPVETLMCVTSVTNKQTNKPPIYNRWRAAVAYEI